MTVLILFLGIASAVFTIWAFVYDWKHNRTKVRIKTKDGYLLLSVPSCQVDQITRSLEKVKSDAQCASPQSGEAKEPVRKTAKQWRQFVPTFACGALIMFITTTLLGMRNSTLPFYLLIKPFPTIPYTSSLELDLGGGRSPSKLPTLEQYETQNQIDTTRLLPDYSREQSTIAYVSNYKTQSTGYAANVTYAQEERQLILTIAPFSSPLENSIIRDGRKISIKNSFLYFARSEDPSLNLAVWQAGDYHFLVKSNSYGEADFIEIVKTIYLNSDSQ